MKYGFIFCFLNKDGSVERDEYGVEIYHREEIEADRTTDALRQFKKLFTTKPEIIKIVRGL